MLCCGLNFLCIFFCLLPLNGYHFLQEFFAESLISRIEELLDNMDVSSQEYLKKVSEQPENERYKYVNNLFILGKVLLACSPEKPSLRPC